MPPSVFDFIDYLAFLKAWFAFKKVQRKGRFGVRAFARLADLSPAEVSMLLNGHRLPTMATLDKVGKAMALTNDERSFLVTLVDVAKASTLRERSRVYERIYRNPDFRRASALDGTILDAYSHWYVMAIRELSLLEHFRPDAEWIAARLVPRITVEQAQEALDTLVRLGLMSVTEDGSLVPREARVQTGSETDRRLGTIYHQSMLDLASQALKVVPSERRQFVAVTVPVPDDMVERLKVEVDAFVQSFINQIDAEPGPRGDIVQLSLQMFTLTEGEQ